MIREEASEMLNGSYLPAAIGQGISVICIETRIVHPVGSSLNSYLSVNSFAMVVYQFVRMGLTAILICTVLNNSEKAKKKKKEKKNDRYKSACACDLHILYCLRQGLESETIVSYCASPIPWS